MITPSLPMLYADLDAMRVALEDGRHDDASSLLNGYDRHLRAFMQGTGAGAALEPLRGLLGQQNSLLSLMRRRRDEASEQLRRLRQSAQAAQAYRA